MKLRKNRFRKSIHKIDWLPLEFEPDYFWLKLRWSTYRTAFTWRSSTVCQKSKKYFSIWQKKQRYRFTREIKIAYWVSATYWCNANNEVVQYSPESGREYRATRFSIPLFVRTAHSLQSWWEKSKFGCWWEKSKFGCSEPWCLTLAYPFVAH